MLASIIGTLVYLVFVVLLFPYLGEGLFLGAVQAPLGGGCGGSPFGLMLGVIAARTRSILPSCVLHMANNL